MPATNELPDATGASDADALVDVADRFRWTAPELAVRFAARALGDAGEVTRRRAQTLLGVSLVHLGRHAEAVEPASAALRAAAGDPDEAGVLRVALAAVARVLGEPMAGCAVLLPVLASDAPRPATRAFALGQFVACAAHVGGRDDMEDALAEADRLLAADDALSHDTRKLERALLCVRAASYHRRHGDTESAAESARDGLVLLNRLTDPAAEAGRVRTRLTLELVCALLDEGNLDEAVAEAAPALAEPVRATSAPALGRLRLALASRVHLPAGRTSTGRALLVDAVRSAERHGLDSLLADAWTFLAHAEEESARPTEALNALRSARAAEYRHLRASAHATTHLTADLTDIPTHDRALAILRAALTPTTRTSTPPHTGRRREATRHGTPRTGSASAQPPPTPRRSATAAPATRAHPPAPTPSRASTPPAAEASSHTPARPLTPQSHTNPHPASLAEPAASPTPPSLSTDPQAPASHPTDSQAPAFHSTDPQTPASRSTDPQTPAFRSADLQTPASRSTDPQTPAFRSADLQTPASRSTDPQTPAFRSADLQTPAFRSADLQTPAFRSADSQAPSRLDDSRSSLSRLPANPQAPSIDAQARLSTDSQSSPSRPSGEQAPSRLADAQSLLSRLSTDSHAPAFPSQASGPSVDARGSSFPSADAQAPSGLPADPQTPSHLAAESASSSHFAVEPRTPSAPLVGGAHTSSSSLSAGPHLPSSAPPFASTERSASHSHQQTPNPSLSDRPPFAPDGQPPIGSGESAHGASSRLGPGSFQVSAEAPAGAPYAPPHGSASDPRGDAPSDPAPAEPPASRFGAPTHLAPDRPGLPRQQAESFAVVLVRIATQGLPESVDPLEPPIPLAGDPTITEFATAVQALAPPHAELLRSDAAEFAVLLPGGSLDQAESLAARVADLPPPTPVHAVHTGAAVTAAGALPTHHQIEHLLTEARATLRPAQAPTRRRASAEPPADQGRRAARRAAETGSGEGRRRAPEEPAPGRRSRRTAEPDAAKEKTGRRRADKDAEFPTPTTPEQPRSGRRARPAEAPATEWAPGKRAKPDEAGAEVTPSSVRSFLDSLRGDTDGGRRSKPSDDSVLDRLGISGPTPAPPPNTPADERLGPGFAAALANLGLGTEGGSIPPVEPGPDIPPVEPAPDVPEVPDPEDVPDPKEPAQQPRTPSSAELLSRLGDLASGKTQVSIDTTDEPRGRRRKPQEDTPEENIWGADPRHPNEPTHPEEPHRPATTTHLTHGAPGHADPTPPPTHTPRLDHSPRPEDEPPAPTPQASQPGDEAPSASAVHPGGEPFPLGLQEGRASGAPGARPGSEAFPVSSEGLQPGGVPVSGGGVARVGGEASPFGSAGLQVGGAFASGGGAGTSGAAIPLSSEGLQPGGVPVSGGGVARVGGEASPFGSGGLQAGGAFASGGGVGTGGAAFPLSSEGLQPGGVPVSGGGVARVGGEAFPLGSEGLQPDGAFSLGSAARAAFPAKEPGDQTASGVGGPRSEGAASSPGARGPQPAPPSSPGGSQLGGEESAGSAGDPEAEDDALPWGTRARRSDAPSVGSSESEDEAASAQPEGGPRAERRPPDPEAPGSETNTPRADTRQTRTSAAAAAWLRRTGQAPGVDEKRRRSLSAVEGGEGRRGSRRERTTSSGLADLLAEAMAAFQETQPAEAEAPPGWAGDVRAGEAWAADARAADPTPAERNAARPPGDPGQSTGRHRSSGWAPADVDSG